MLLLHPQTTGGPSAHETHCHGNVTWQTLTPGYEVGNVRVNVTLFARSNTLNVIHNHGTHCYCWIEVYRNKKKTSFHFVYPNFIEICEVIFEISCYNRQTQRERDATNWKSNPPHRGRGNDKPEK